ncbi:MAG: N-6 DNA methylase [Desulfobacteraceae bacterium]|nr:N-6 DNA methylase [Desulfobacteraceae bacterium]
MIGFPDNEFKNSLKKFDMILESSEPSPGLVFVGEKIEDHSERIALEYAEKYQADAVYFRRFDGNRSPIPQIYIYDFTRQEKKESELAELYKRLWNSCQVPLFFVFFKTEVKIFSCLKQPKLDDKTGRISISFFEKIKLASKAKKEFDKLNKFSARKFDNGTFWSTPEYENKFTQKESAYVKLLDELKRTRQVIIQKEILPKNIAQRLLVMSILVKYLEEREDENGSKVFPEGFFKSFSVGEDSFISVLRKQSACLDLFDHLSSPACFNGEIFKWEDKEERKILKKADLNTFADFLEGRLDNGQYTFWSLYSFNDLPIELISNIYEEFLESKKDGIVYTPPYLVNFLIDELMPLSDFYKTDFKVIDPACGSGIFLVAAYRRMLHWWRIRNGWKKPDAENLDELKQILKNNIFGVDKHEEAVRLTFFSLSLALLDELSPKVIWKNLKFDNLAEENLIGKDFFEVVNHGLFQPEFDAVIGNPPFMSKLTPGAREIENGRKKQRPQLPDNQIALLFLEQGMRLCKPDAWLCLIMPAGPFLYNNNSEEFRNCFLQTFHVPQLADFTFLSEVLFESAKVATVAVFAQNKKPYQKELLHLTVRRTKSAKEKLWFELDHYDFHKVSYRDATENRLVWKANLLGGGRLQRLMARFVSVRSLGEYLYDKEKNNGWKIAEGFIVGNKKEINELVRIKANKKNLSQNEKDRLKKLEKKYKTADYLTGKRTLPTNAFDEKGIDETQIHILKEKYFLRSRKRNKDIFKGPHLLIKEVTKNSIPVAFRDDDLSFKDKIIGIYTPADQADELRKIEKRIKNNRIYLFHAAGFSGQYMVSRVTAILKKDIESLPFPEDEFELSEFDWILIDDVLDYILNFRRKGEASVAEKPVTDNQLELFADIYCRTLNSVYKNFKPYKPIKTGTFICFPFYYEDKPEILTHGIDEIEADLYELIENNTKINARIIRMLRIYEDNTVYLIKPVQTRYWLRSAAIRDADETFADLIAQGY